MLVRLRSAGLRRRLGAGLLLLALCLQAFAPAALLLARARSAEVAAADALIHRVICGQDAGTDGVAALPAPAPEACDRCPFCRCTAAPPPITLPETAIRHVAWHEAAWPIPPPARPHGAPRSSHGARAPPQIV